MGWFPTRILKCDDCGAEFTTTASNTKHCPACRVSRKAKARKAKAAKAKAAADKPNR